MDEETATVRDAQHGDPGGEGAVLLRRLIAIDTSNPPGNEREAQTLLAEELTEAGFDCELLGTTPGRPNLTARLSSGVPGPTLCLLGHIDTVPADPAAWTRDPWSGELVDGEVWGRGALDMKGQVAAEVAAAASLGRRGWRPSRGGLLVVISVDEEAGGGLGARWLCEEHPGRVRADLVVNEGGGASFELDGRRFYTLCVGEKGVFRFRVRTRGRAGHASVPALGDNALLRLAPLLERLGRQPPPMRTEAGAQFLSVLLGEEPPPDAGAVVDSLDRLRELAPEVTSYLAEPMLGVTVSPTMARASESDNVIPASAEVLVDCRVPPDIGEEETLGQIEELLRGPDDRDGHVEIAFAERVPGNFSPSRSSLAEAISGWLAGADPEARLVPIVMPGFSDSHWFRRAFPEATVYGFCPHRAMSLREAVPLIHGADERVPLADVELATRFFEHLPQAILGGPT